MRWRATGAFCEDGASALARSNESGVQLREGGQLLALEILGAKARAENVAASENRRPRSMLSELSFGLASFARSIFVIVIWETLTALYARNTYYGGGHDCLLRECVNSINCFDETSEREPCPWNVLLRLLCARYLESISV